MDIPYEDFLHNIPFSLGLLDNAKCWQSMGLSFEQREVHKPFTRGNNVKLDIWIFDGLNVVCRLFIGGGSYNIQEINILNLIDWTKPPTFLEELDNFLLRYFFGPNIEIEGEKDKQKIN